MSIELTQFTESLSRAVYDNITAVFPEMEFKRYGDKLISGKKSDLTTGKKKIKSVIKKQSPAIIFFNDESEQALSIFQFYGQIHGIQTTGGGFIQILDEMAERAGIEKFRRENYEELTRRRKTLSAIYDRTKNELFSPSGRDTLEYLKSRGYSAELIIKMGFGHITNETANDLNKLFRDTDGHRYVTNAAQYPLVIPQFDGGILSGFIFRAIGETSTNGHKYNKPAAIYGQSEINIPANLSSLVLCEGEIDALHARAVGLNNFAAIGGANLTEKSVMKIIRRGIENVVFLFDRDDNAGTRDNISSRTAAAVDLCRKNGISVRIAAFPESDGKTDIDEYLNEHQPDELTAIIDSAITPAKFISGRILETGRKTGRASDDIARDIAAESLKFNAGLDYAIFFQAFQQAAGIETTRADFDDERRAISDAERRRELLNKAAETNREINESIRAGNIQQIKSKIEALNNDLKIAGQTDEFSEIIADATNFDAIIKNGAEIPDGISTDYAVGEKQTYDRVRITFDAAALTAIGARTSHRKSTFALNMALDVAENESGTCIFITNEESKESVLYKAISMQFRRNITRFPATNFSAIHHYFKTGRTNDPDFTIYDESGQIAGREYIEEKADRIRKLYESGKIEIYDYDFNVDELQTFLNVRRKKSPISAVFIDYLQRLKRPESEKKQKNEILCDITGDLINMAKNMRIPFILAVQLNRMAANPFDMESANVAESEDIARGLSKFIVLWYFRKDIGNLSERDIAKLQDRIHSNTQRIQDDGQITSDFQRNRTTAPTNESHEDFKKYLREKGKLFVRIVKNRNGVVDSWDLLDMDESSGYIYPNYTTGETAPEKPISESFK